MSRRLIILSMLLVGFIWPSMLWADGPATRPTAKIAVLAFDVIGDAGHEWIGRAMQEGLANAIQIGSEIQAVTVAGLGPFDVGSAATAGKNAGADLAVFGNIQVTGSEIRIVGQIVDVNSGKSVGNLRSDADVRDLFTVEDVLAQRVGRLVTSPAAVKAPPARASFELVGPTLTPQAPRYYDGNLGEILTPPQRFSDEYDQYYYYGSMSSWAYPFCGWGCNWFGGWSFGFGNPWFFPTSAPVSSW